MRPVFHLVAVSQLRTAQPLPISLVSRIAQLLCTALTVGFFFVCPIDVKGAVVLDPLPPSPSVPPLRQSTASPGYSYELLPSLSCSLWEQLPPEV